MSMAGSAKTAGNKEGIGLPEAVETAREYMLKAYGRNLEGLQLEETEISDDDSHWLITLGFLRDAPNTSGVFAVTPYRSIERVYKVVTIDARTGDVKSMKIREL